MFVLSKVFVCFECIDTIKSFVFDLMLIVCFFPFLFQFFQMAFDINVIDPRVNVQVSCILISILWRCQSVIFLGHVLLVIIGWSSTIIIPVTMNFSSNFVHWRLFWKTRIIKVRRNQRFVLFVLLGFIFDGFFLLIYELNVEFFDFIGILFHFPLKCILNLSVLSLLLVEVKFQIFDLSLEILLILL